MIISMKPLSLPEVKEMATNLEQNEALALYLDKFTKLTKEKAEAMAEELRALNNSKIDDSQIVKIIDLMPKDAEDVNKIFTDMSLDEKETNDVLDIVKKY